MALGERFCRQRDAAGRREVRHAAEVRVRRHEVVDVSVHGVAEADGGAVDERLEALAARARGRLHVGVGEEVHARGHPHEPRQARRRRRRRLIRRRRTRRRRRSQRQRQRGLRPGGLRGGGGQRQGEEEGGDELGGSHGCLRCGRAFVGDGRRAVPNPAAGCLFRSCSGYVLASVTPA